MSVVLRMTTCARVGAVLCAMVFEVKETSVNQMLSKATAMRFMFQILDMKLSKDSLDRNALDSLEAGYYPPSRERSGRAVGRPYTQLNWRGGYFDRAG